MDEREFEATWQSIQAKLTPTEREIVETVIAGAQTNHTLLYMLACVLLGGLGGWALCALTGGG